MAYFHIEDAFEQRMNYETNTSALTLIEKTQVNNFIANEIRLQVNGSQQRSIFSVSKSLGIVLFKYNKIGDNPLHIIPINYLDQLEVSISPNDTHFLIPYGIQNTAQLSKGINQSNFYLHNYVIDVSNDNALNQYLHTYTPVGKYPYAACEKDKEVLMRHITPDFTISDEIYIDAVYLIYALNYRYGFLQNLIVFNCIINLFQYHTQDNVNAYYGFYTIINHLICNQDFEKYASTPIILEKQNEGRFVCDMYYVALEILDTALEDSLYMAYDTSVSYCNYNLLNDIWKIFWQWKRS